MKTPPVHTPVRRGNGFGARVTELRPTVGVMAAKDGGGQQHRSTRGQRPQRSVRVDDCRWNALKAKARRRRETVTKVILRKIDEYLAEDD